MTVKTNKEMKLEELYAQLTVATAKVEDVKTEVAMKADYLKEHISAILAPFMISGSSIRSIHTESSYSNCIRIECGFPKDNGWDFGSEFTIEIEKGKKIKVNHGCIGTFDSDNMCANRCIVLGNMFARIELLEDQFIKMFNGSIYTSYQQAKSCLQKANYEVEATLSEINSIKRLAVITTLEAGSTYDSLCLNYRTHNNVVVTKLTAKYVYFSSDRTYEDKYDKNLFISAVVKANDNH